ncbi:hypothetical protein GCM10027040_22810 [Halomonas shantousis]
MYSTGRRYRHRTHWWLASLLVGYLLPAGLVQAEALRVAERLTCICLLAPEAIRAESRRVADRRFWRPFTARVPRFETQLSNGLPPWHAPSADHDVLSRRGPPGGEQHRVA